MKFLSQIEDLRRIDQLIRLKATGSTDDLASRLDVARATVYRYITLLKEKNAPICYCKHRKSYYYETPFNLDFNQW